MLRNMNRESEFPALFKSNLIYADHAGAALPPASLIRHHHTYHTTYLLGNPHSSHQPSQISTDVMNSARYQVLKFLNAPPSEYDVIFTSNATSAIKLLHHVNFDDGEILLTADNHNSMNGLREVVRRKGGRVQYIPVSHEKLIGPSSQDFRLSVAEETMLEYLRSPQQGSGPRVFGFPAKSNFTGVQHPLWWVREAQAHGWLVLLDASAHLANNRLDLNSIRPDFVPMSFYKIFGFPTGLGCLVIKKTAYKDLHKQYFAGGAIKRVGIAHEAHVNEDNGPTLYEDGTQNFGSAPSVVAGFDFVNKLDRETDPTAPAPGRLLHASRIAAQLWCSLNNISVGCNRIDIYSPKGSDIVSFNVVKSNKIIGSRNIESLAQRKNICLRSGCHCNPGANEALFGHDKKSLAQYFKLSNIINLENPSDMADNRPYGAVRASFGYSNTMRDAEIIADFVKKILLD